MSFNLGKMGEIQDGRKVRVGFSSRHLPCLVTRSSIRTMARRGSCSWLLSFGRQTRVLAAASLSLAVSCEPKSCALCGFKTYIVLIPVDLQTFREHDVYKHPHTADTYTRRCICILIVINCSKNIIHTWCMYAHTICIYIYICTYIYTYIHTYIHNIT